MSFELIFKDWCYGKFANKESKHSASSKSLRASMNDGYLSRITCVKEYFGVTYKCSSALLKSF